MTSLFLAETYLQDGKIFSSQNDKKELYLQYTKEYFVLFHSLTLTITAP